MLLYRLRIHVVWADAAYFNYSFLGFVRNVLHASVNVDYNLRRQGKRFLADSIDPKMLRGDRQILSPGLDRQIQAEQNWIYSDLLFIRQWRDLSPCANIERHFAWLKRYFGLKYFRVQGYLAVTQFVFRVYVAALIIAFVAARHRRPELATSRLKVLVFADTRSITKGVHSTETGGLHCLGNIGG